MKKPITREAYLDRLWLWIVNEGLCVAAEEACGLDCWKTGSQCTKKTADMINTLPEGDGASVGVSMVTQGLYFRKRRGTKGNRARLSGSPFYTPYKPLLPPWQRRPTSAHAK